VPKNRNAQLRYQIIDQCLKNRGRKWSWFDIIEKINEVLWEENSKSDGIGKSTFYEDLRDMENIFRIEIERVKQGRNVYYRYVDANASINTQVLNAHESEVIKNSVLVLSRFRGTPQFEWLNEIIPALESKFGLISSEKEIISFESNIDYSGTAYISPIFNAIRNMRVLKISYQDFKSSNAYEVELHPQYLKQYNSRWFLISLSDKWEDKFSTHALDRIKKVEEIKGNYRELKNFDWDNYFSDMIGVSRMDVKPVEVKLLILDSEQASYIDTKPLHQTQKKMKKVENGYETSIFVIPNYELEKLILSFGERIKVISPTEIADIIKSHIKKMNTLYT